MTVERVAVVTGGGRGIGYATCKALSDAGYMIVLMDRDQPAADAARARLSSGGRRVEALEVDVASPHRVSEAFATVASMVSQIDVLVNNAGSIGPGPAESLPHEVWTDLLSAHLSGTFACCKSAFPLLRAAEWPAIVNVSSIGAAVGMPRRGAYCGAKSGIEGFTRSLAVEWGPLRIRVNAVAPGHIVTDMTKDALRAGLLSRDRVAARINRIPLVRLGQPEEIAAAILFLASRDARYITGAVLTVDGGYSINGDEMAGEPGDGVGSSDRVSREVTELFEASGPGGL